MSATLHPAAAIIAEKADLFMETVLTGLRVTQPPDEPNLQIHIESLKTILIDVYLEGVLEFLAFGMASRGIEIPDSTAHARIDLSNLFELQEASAIQVNKFLDRITRCIEDLARCPLAENPCVRMTAVQSRPCKSCQAMIHFCIIHSGKPHPFNSDGTSHYATCPKAEEHRQRLKPKSIADTLQEPLFEFQAQTNPYDHS